MFYPLSVSLSYIMDTFCGSPTCFVATLDAVSVFFKIMNRVASSLCLVKVLVGSIYQRSTTDGCCMSERYGVEKHYDGVPGADPSHWKSTLMPS